MRYLSGDQPRRWRLFLIAFVGPLDGWPGSYRNETLRRNIAMKGEISLLVKKPKDKGKMFSCVYLRLGMHTSPRDTNLNDEFTCANSASRPKSSPMMYRGLTSSTCATLKRKLGQIRFWNELFECIRRNSRIRPGQPRSCLAEYVLMSLAWALEYRNS